jgi:hypothetical protein
VTKINQKSDQKVLEKKTWYPLFLFEFANKVLHTSELEGEVIATAAMCRIPELEGKVIATAAMSIRRQPKLKSPL